MKKHTQQLTEAISQQNIRLDKLKQPNFHLKISSRNTILTVNRFFSYLRRNAIYFQVIVERK